MNVDPNTSGITKYWRDGADDRRLVLDELSLGSGGRRVGRGHVDELLRALWAVVSRRRRTKLVGFGVFEWRPWRRRLPTGRMVETWRLAFKPSRYAKRYKGGR